MTYSLYWKPIVKNENYLGDKLKFALRNRYGGHIPETTLDFSDLGYLQGLVDAGVREAVDLIEAIEKHEKIEIGEV